jgi:hypothetical protein
MLDMGRCVYGRGGEQEALIYCWWQCKLVQSLWTSVQGSSKI